eukprot:CAMPEP_0198116214 /NCGR_PEP_ID=MMETSP1442-20131203/10611_1 /TAXON_ID= /ORGANISM="Craspedostauros australis, Strain CCMP3328" /LENGTH=712 /DNA_ID=CAMNT_0043773975 /DNA_START=81 /DNA_END=2219 /DNA_ORIENTATION=+
MMDMIANANTMVSACQSKVLAISMLLFATATCIDAIYLPGVDPHSFRAHDVVPLHVGKLTSSAALFPMDYYGLPFCRPAAGVHHLDQNFGQLLAGDRTSTSPYELRMQQEVYCQQLCSMDLGSAQKDGTEPNTIVAAIQNAYHHHWIVDNLNSAAVMKPKNKTATNYWQGFPVGFVSAKDGLAYVNNHVNIIVTFHSEDFEPDSHRIVKFAVEPLSIKHDFAPAETKGEEGFDGVIPDQFEILNPLESSKKDSREHTTRRMTTAKGRSAQLASGPVLFTYDVIWIEDPFTRWASRWDIYMSNDDTIPFSRCWQQLFRGLVDMIVMLIMITAILCHNLQKQREQYGPILTHVATVEDSISLPEDQHWRLVCRDVFRPPPPTAALLLSAACGTGAQLFSTSSLVIIFGALGFLNPARRGSLMMGWILFFVLSGTVNGYVTARLYKTLRGGAWRWAKLTACFMLPVPAVVVFAFMDLLSWRMGSTLAVPFMSALAVCAILLAFHVMFVSAGARFGYSASPVESPMPISDVPQQIPKQPRFMNPFITTIACGIFPCTLIFAELTLILANLWKGYTNYAFGYTLMVFILFAIECAMISILVAYLQLCNRDYHWWWRSFCTAGSPVIYIFIVVIIFGTRHLGISSVEAMILYYGYMAFFSLCAFVMLGAVGFFATFWFTLKLYSTIEDADGHETSGKESELTLDKGSLHERQAVLDQA